MSNKMFMRVEEVAEEMGVSVPYAYKLIRQLNKEPEGDGLYHYCRKNRQKVLPRKILFHKNNHRKGSGQWQHLKTRKTELGMYSFDTRTGKESDSKS